jgi:hypothetical protein
MRAVAKPSVLAIGLGVLTACSGDDGKPSSPVVIVIADSGPSPSDAGGDAGGEAGPPAKKGDAVDCNSDDECASNVCFKGGKAGWCSYHCTVANATQVCPNPPFDGTCNNQGYCRRPN